MALPHPRPPNPVPPASLPHQPRRGITNEIINYFSTGLSGRREIIKNSGWRRRRRRQREGCNQGSTKTLFCLKIVPFCFQNVFCSKHRFKTRFKTRDFYTRVLGFSGFSCFCCVFVCCVIAMLVLCFVLDWLVIAMEL